MAPKQKSENLTEKKELPAPPRLTFEDLMHSSLPSLDVITLGERREQRGVFCRQRAGCESPILGRGSSVCPRAGPCPPQSRVPLRHPPGPSCGLFEECAHQLLPLPEGLEILSCSSFENLFLFPSWPPYCQALDTRRIPKSFAFLEHLSIL